MSIMLRRSHVFTVFTGARKLLCQLLAAPAVIVGEQHELLAIRLEPPDTLQQPLQFLGHLSPRQRIRSVGGNIHGCRLFLDRRFAPLSDDIDRPVAGNRRHPRDRGRQAGIELPRIVPDLDVSVLNDLLREILTPQDTEHHAEQFRPRGAVEALESGLVPLRNSGDQPDQFSRRQH